MGIIIIRGGRNDQNAEGNATVQQVLAGRTFSNSDEVGLIGQMANNGGLNYTPSTIAQGIPEGYHNGAGSVEGDADLISANIKAGITIFGVSGKTTVVDTEAANAIAAMLIVGRTAYVNGQLITGTMLNRSTGDYVADGISTSSNTLRFSIPEAGFYGDGANIIQQDADWIESNIKSGVNIFGKQGSFTSDGNASASQILEGLIAYVNSQRIVGTMLNRATGTFGADSVNSSGVRLTLGIPNDGFYGDSASIFVEDGDFIPQNIRTGVNIFGKVGTYTSDGNVLANQMLAGAVGYSAAGRVVGSMLNRATGTYGASAVTPGSNYVDLTISASGFYGNTAKIRATDNDFVAANIKAGVNIFGRSGTFTSDGNASASQVLSGRVVYVNGQRIVGSMSNRSGSYNADSVSRTGNTLRFSIPGNAFYHDSAFIQNTDNDWVESNIRSGINMFGKIGTANVLPNVPNPSSLSSDGEGTGQISFRSATVSPSGGFSRTEVYVSTSDIRNLTRAQCLAGQSGAVRRFNSGSNGANSAFVLTGVSTGRTIYIKAFTVASFLGQEFYSSGSTLTDFYNPPPELYLKRAGVKAGSFTVNTGVNHGNNINDFVVQTTSGGLVNFTATETTNYSSYSQASVRMTAPLPSFIPSINMRLIGVNGASGVSNTINLKSVLSSNSNGTVTFDISGITGNGQCQLEINYNFGTSATIIINDIRLFS